MSVVRTWAVAFGLALINQAHASSIRIDTKLEWLAQAEGISRDDFESYGWSDSVWLGFSNEPRTLSGVTYAANNRMSGVGRDNMIEGPLQGSSYFSWSAGYAGAPSNVLSVSLPKAVTALSFDFAKFYGSPGLVGLVLPNGELFEVRSGRAESVFFGILTELPFSSFQLVEVDFFVNSNNGGLIDNLSWGNRAIRNSAPEPSSFLLVGCALGMLAAIRRSRIVTPGISATKC